MEPRRTSAELLKALRGRRSQRLLSQRLGYASNVLGRWESGRSWPAAESFFALAEHLRVDVAAGLSAFLRAELKLPSGSALTERRGVVRFLEAVVGDLSIVFLAQRLGRSRFVVSRWLDGTTAIRLPDLLALVEACTVRGLDFVSVFVSPARVPSLRAAWLALEASRNAAYEHPWSHAVLRALELAEYARLPRHVDGWIAERLGVSIETERSCLQILDRAGQIVRRTGRWVVSKTQTVDFRRDRERARELRGFWLDVARDRHRAGDEGVFAYNLCSISHADHARLVALHRTFFAEMQRIVAASKPSECVVLLATQLLALDAPMAATKTHAAHRQKALTRRGGPRARL